MPRDRSHSPGARPAGFALPALCLVMALSGCVTVHAPPLAAGPGEATALFQHDGFDAFLSRHVDDRGRLDYAAAAGDRSDLDRYLVALATASPDATPDHFPSDADRLAYWLNAYNAWAIALVLEHYPIASVREVPSPAPARWVVPDLAGFFFFQHVTLGGETLSLYELENGVVRERFPDPRIHFALNCASRSCPRLPAEAFRPTTLEAQLARETRRFLGEARNFEVRPGDREIHLSSIFDWYTDDFTDWVTQQDPAREASLESYVRLAHPDGDRVLAGCEDCRLVFVPYDWGLNDRAPAQPVASP
ncbi:MAG: DUF547 domain-containing protein [Myxococcota bacterium]